MEDTVKKEYQFKRGNLLLLPYDPRVGVYKEDALIDVYKRLKQEDLWDIVFHEDSGVTMLKFMNFFSDGRSLLQVLAISDGKNIVDIVGMAWISDITTCGGILTRGVGSFLFFKDYQKPHFTDLLGEMIIEYWFTQLGLDVVVGVTPLPNRAALIYAKRTGFKEVGRLPHYTTFKGEVVTGVVTSMTKQEYLELSVAGGN
jgi:RimJ/RimL family protein N-acetyltransferase